MYIVLRMIYLLNPTRKFNERRLLFLVFYLKLTSSSSVMVTLPTATERHRTFFIWNLIVAFRSFTYSTYSIYVQCTFCTKYSYVFIYLIQKSYSTVRSTEPEPEIKNVSFNKSLEFPLCGIKFFLHLHLHLQDIDRESIPN